MMVDAVCEATEVVIDGLDEIEIENTSIDEIDAENVNLIFIGIDESVSMRPYVNDMMSALTNFKNSIMESKEADQILIARADFNNVIKYSGYKRIENFDTDYVTDGMTSLYDVIVEGTDKLLEYRKFLKDSGMRVKAVFAIFSDGEDVGSKNTHSRAKKAINELNSAEITTAYMCFGNTSKSEAKSLGFRNILEISSSASDLRKAFDCLSKSVIESSKSVVADKDDFFAV